jgi:tRNA(fMet)-specific endonuclease VapC
MNYLLDTNVISAVVDAQNSALLRFSQIRPEDNLYSSVITEGELLFGVANASATGRPQLLAEITGVLGDLAGIVSPSREAAEVYGNMKYYLKVTGQPIADNDLWIAAMALADDFTLVSHDDGFRRVPNLKLEDWLA